MTTTYATCAQAASCLTRNSRKCYQVSGVRSVVQLYAELRSSWNHEAEDFITTLSFTLKHGFIKANKDQSRSRQ